ncbi:alpha/beta-hydrolase [Gloeophyllum trabeum ATCC 11539]|uniref:Alpha/beta-hydrolase n=1 Tax=Gloeophyllum trabeum (strain ATCC 11539 / FP-39264 / Madison 617) TaxID=670483 RepID=S7PTQ3_GLOTA|nr:alpha/beta-hydrolase [Gloeophyllum trabeum ATCC 11539]EPQ50712.1 alpha/beta-hydrolase [Gloeophyllum trabeum ATCC 11539]
MAPLYTYQPFKAAYFAYFALSLLVKVPLWSIYYLPCRNRQRASWDLRRALIVKVAQSLSAFPIKVNLRQKVDPGKTYENAQFAWIEPVDDSLVVGRLREYATNAGVSPARISGYWIFKPGFQFEGGGPPKAVEDEKTVLHFHGGGFTTGSANPNFITSNITKGILQYSHILKRTFGVEYRLASSPPDTVEIENPFPAAILDALATYRYLVQEMGFKPENIIVAGDSAGGHIAQVLVRYLMENHIASLPPPGYLVLISTVLDLSFSRNVHGSSDERKRFTDIFNPHKPLREVMAYSTSSILGKLSEEQAKIDPFLSPISPHMQPTKGIFRGFPSAYVVAGGAERLCDDSEVLVEMMREDGVKVVRDIPSDAIHDFLSFHWHEPERTQTLIRISRWVDEL